MRLRFHALVTAALLLLVPAAALAAESGEFGNECVMGLALGKDIQTDCAVHADYKGKTYCFGNEKARTVFFKNPDEFLAKAQAYYSSKQPVTAPAKPQ